MEREEELEQTIDDLNYRLTNALKNIDRLKSNIKQAREEIQSLDGRYVIGDYAIYGDNIPKYLQESEVLAILDKLIESEEK